MKQTKNKRNNAAGGPPAGLTVPGEPVWPDPQPEQRPWRAKEDAEGQEVVYRGRGQRRRVRSHLLVEFTPEQDAWLAKTAAAAGITTAELLRRLVDHVREAEAGRCHEAGVTGAAVGDLHR